MDSCYVSGALEIFSHIKVSCRPYVLLRIIFIFIIITNINCDFSKAKLYHFDNSSGYLDSNWKSNALCMWKYPVSDGDHPHNFFLTTDLIGGNIWRNLSREVDGGDGSSTLTFDWRKIGADAEFIFYFDNDTDRGHIRICNCYNDLCPVDPIPIPPGRHNATWNFTVSSSNNDIAGSQAWLDNINIPEICVLKPDCTITAPTEVPINSTNEASVPYQSGAIYHWGIIEGGFAISGVDSNVLTWRAGDCGKVKLEATVSKSGCAISNFTNVAIKPYCAFVDPMNIRSIMSRYQNKIKIFYLDNTICNNMLFLDNIKNIIICSYNSLDSGFYCSNNPCIKLENCSNVTIMNLSLSSNKCGIELKNSHNCKILGNYLNFYDGPGIYLNSSNNNDVEYNQIQQSDIGIITINETGIQLFNADDNSIANNKISMLYNFTDYWLEGCKYNKITISDCGAIQCDNNIFYSLNNNFGRMIFVDKNGINLSESMTVNHNTWKCVNNA